MIRGFGFAHGGVAHWGLRPVVVVMAQRVQEKPKRIIFNVRFWFYLPPTPLLAAVSSSRLNQCSLFRVTVEMLAVISKRVVVTFVLLSLLDLEKHLDCVKIGYKLELRICFKRTKGTRRWRLLREILCCVGR